MNTEDPKPDDGLIGRTVAQRYRIHKRIARGGMGVVYVGEHLRLQRPIVFKVLSEHLSDDDKATARFEQEALGLSRLNHPNIVTVYDFGVEEGLTYIVMEFVPGRTLSQVLRDEGVMSFDRLLPLAVQVVQAIGAAHEKDIVHRDIKPANIMVVSEPGRPDVVKVLDFGLARLTSSSLDITKDNLVGTVSYVAPEVVKGSRAGKAADVYALAVMFYFMLTGRKPFRAEDDLSVLYKHVHDKPAPISDLLPSGHDVPVAFVELIERCMAKEPTDRPADGNALLAELSDVVSLPSIPRISSGEFVEIQRAAAAAAVEKDRPGEPGNVPGIVPGVVPGAVPAEVAVTAMSPMASVELSSVALRERPNSRWGIPLIALCVFAAGAAAILLMTDVGGQPGEDAPSEKNWGVVDTTGGSTLEDDDHAKPDELGPAVEEAATSRSDSAAEASPSSGGSENEERPPTRPKGAPRVKVPSSNESADIERDRQTPPQARQESDSEGTTGESDQGAEEFEEIDTLPADETPELLDVDDSSDSILLPVD